MLHAPRSAFEHFGRRRGAAEHCDETRPQNARGRLQFRRAVRLEAAFDRLTELRFRLVPGQVIDTTMKKICAIRHVSSALASQGIRFDAKSARTHALCADFEGHHREVL